MKFSKKMIIIGLFIIIGCLVETSILLLTLLPTVRVKEATTDVKKLQLYWPNHQFDYIAQIASECGKGEKASWSKPIDATPISNAKLTTVDIIFQNLQKECVTLGFSGPNSFIPSARYIFKDPSKNNQAVAILYEERYSCDLPDYSFGVPYVFTVTGSDMTSEPLKDSSMVVNQDETSVSIRAIPEYLSDFDAFHQHEWDVAMDKLNLKDKIENILYDKIVTHFPNATPLAVSAIYNDLPLNPDGLSAMGANYTADDIDNFYIYNDYIGIDPDKLELHRKSGLRASIYNNDLFSGSSNTDVSTNEDGTPKIILVRCIHDSRYPDAGKDCMIPKYAVPVRTYLQAISDICDK